MIEASPCCNKLRWLRGSEEAVFTKTNQINEFYNVYETIIEESSPSMWWVTMWWMWHGSVGHWVVNQTPGMHGGDIIKSSFADVVCPDEVANWEDPSGAANQVTCVEEPECRPLVGGTNVAENIQLGPEWEVEIDFKPRFEIVGSNY